MKFQKFLLNRINYLILILLSIVFLPSVKAIVKPTNNFYINDYANILSSETEEYILNKSVALEKVDGTQIVVVTVPNLEGMAIEDYSIRLARDFEIGSKEKNNGLLLLIALEERELRIEVGTGLEGIIPDGKAGRFRDQYMIPYLKDNNWDEGIKNGYDAFFKEIVTLNNLNISYDEPVNLDDSSDYESIGSFWMFITIVSGIIIGTMVKESKNKKRNTLIYLGIWVILFMIFKIVFIIICIFLLLNLVFFLIGRFGTISGYGYYGGGSSGRGSSRGGSSGGGFTGGGGSFRGGGASGRF